MIVANPIYDVVFKRLMENERVAKFFISTLTEQEIEHLQLKPQEFTYDKIIGITVLRLDFIATIKTQEGYKKVLIELQKAYEHIDIMRFRNYLAEQYKKEDTINGEKIVLPITTIYILGFNIPEIDSPCFKVERIYKDLINKQIIPKKSDFVEKLTHDSYIVQVRRISGKYQTRLEKLLSLFEQAYFIQKDNNIIKEYPHAIDIDEIKLMANILEHVAANPEQRKLIETEQEAWRTVEAYAEGVQKNLYLKLEQEKQRAEQEKQRAEQEKQRAEQKQKELEQQKKRLKQKQKELEQEKQKIISMIHNLKNKGMSEADIQDLLGINLKDYLD